MLNKNPVQKNPNLPYLRVGGIKPFKNLESSLYNVMLRRISLKRLLRGNPPPIIADYWGGEDSTPHRFSKVLVQSIPKFFWGDLIVLVGQKKIFRALRTFYARKMDFEIKYFRKKCHFWPFLRCSIFCSKSVVNSR